MAKVKVGQAVKITEGPNAGAVGVVFWKGVSRRDPKLSRFGVRDNEGTVHWVDETQVEPGVLPLEAATFGHGDSVLVIDGESRGYQGKVFWIGASKHRPGMRRYGLKDEEGGQAVFADSKDLRAA